MMEWWAILLIVLACVIVGGFLLLFAVYFFNLDMKLISIVYKLLGKHYDKMKRDNRL